MIIYEAFEWRVYNDRAESGHLAYFTTIEDARTATFEASGQSVPVGAKTPQVPVYDIESWRAKIVADHQANGLKKLTAEEREALGLTEA